jgi:hypothetical protein
MGNKDQKNTNINHGKLTRRYELDMDRGQRKALWSLTVLWAEKDFGITFLVSKRIRRTLLKIFTQMCAACSVPHSVAACCLTPYLTALYVTEIVDVLTVTVPTKERTQYNKTHIIQLLTSAKLLYVSALQCHLQEVSYKELDSLKMALRCRNM